MFATIGPSGDSVCFKIMLNGLEISIAGDNSCGSFGREMKRTEVRVFEDRPGGRDVTDRFLGEGEGQWMDGAGLLRLLRKVAGE